MSGKYARYKTRYQTDPEFRRKTLEWQRNHRTPEVSRKRNLWSKYRMTPEEFTEMFERQGRCCAICLGTEPGGKGQWMVDHDHESGENRAILCHACNLMLGFAKDSMAILQNAVKYLERFTKEAVCQ